MGLVFERLWLSEPCRMRPDHTVFVSKEKDGRWRLSLVVRAQAEVRIVRELVTVDDGEALRVLGLLTRHPDPAAFCDCALAGEAAGVGIVTKGTVSAQRCEIIYRAMRSQSHAA